MNYKLSQVKTKKTILLVTSLLLMASAVLLVSCVDEVNVKKEKTKYQIGSEINKVEVVTIDSCEYLYGPWGNATVLTHKGNCKNSYHYR